MIDWNEQWALHAPTFKNGFAHVSLKNGKSFRMMPGPGFGDLSHPTTRLMLEMLPEKIEGTVLDIGCGSGVLSLAAKLLGADRVIGIDIEDGAISHARENAELNGLDCFFGKTLPQIEDTPLILMNMISSEQKVAWKGIPSFEGALLITSGFPVEEMDPPHFEKRELEGWKSFRIRL